MGEQVEVLCLSSSTLKAFFYGFIVACAKKEALTEVDYVSKGFMSNQRIELFKKLNGENNVKRRIASYKISLINNEINRLSSTNILIWV